MRLFRVGVFLLPALTCFGQTESARLSVPVPDSCKLFDPVVQTPVALGDKSSVELPSRLLAIYNNQARLVRSLKTVAEVNVIRGPKFGASAGRSRTIGSFMDFEQPASLRVTGVVPLVGSKVFDMTSDGREFHLLAPDHHKLTFFVGPAEAKPDFTAGNLNLRPQEFLDALRWVEGRLTLAKEASGPNQENRGLVEIELPPRNGKSATGKLQFNLEKGTVSSLVIYDQAGEVASELHYGDWREMSKAPGETETGCFPRRLKVVHPNEDFQIEIRFFEVMLNPKIDRGRFRMTVPRGVPNVHVNE